MKYNTPTLVAVAKVASLVLGISTVDFDNEVNQTGKHPADIVSGLDE